MTTLSSTQFEGLDPKRPDPIAGRQRGLRMAISLGASPRQQEARIAELLEALGLEEKVFMLSGHGFFEQIKKDGGRYCAHLYAIGAGIERLGIPPLLFMDGPRGLIGLERRLVHSDFSGMAAR
jgi:hypothetical protein